MSNKNIKTSEDLFDNISEEIAWRTKELLWIKSTSATEGSALPYALRAGVPIAYAHLEGSIKNIANSYLDYVHNFSVRKDLEYRHLTDNFLAVGLRGKIKEVKDSKKHSMHSSLIRSVYEIRDKKADFNHKGAINTESNLKSSVLEDVCSVIGLDSSIFSSKFKIMDSVILKLRNEIAHGGKIHDIDLDVERFLEICDVVLWIINKFSDEIMECALEQRFLIQNDVIL